MIILNRNPDRLDHNTHGQRFTFFRGEMVVQIILEAVRSADPLFDTRIKHLILLGLPVLQKKKYHVPVTL